MAGRVHSQCMQIPGPGQVVLFAAPIQSAACSTSPMRRQRWRRRARTAGASPIHHGHAARVALQRRVGACRCRHHLHRLSLPAGRSCACAAAWTGAPADTRAGRARRRRTFSPVPRRSRSWRAAKWGRVSSGERSTSRGASSRRGAIARGNHLALHAAFPRAAVLHAVSAPRTTAPTAATISRAPPAASTGEGRAQYTRRGRVDASMWQSRQSFKRERLRSLSACRCFVCCGPYPCRHGCSECVNQRWGPPAHLVA